MILRWLRAFDGIEPGAITWEAPALARIYIAHGYAVETGLDRFPRAKARRIDPADPTGVDCPVNEAGPPPADKVLATPRQPSGSP